MLTITVPLMEQMECGEGGDPLAREVAQWAAGANSRLISLQGVERDEDEKVSLQFKIESYQVIGRMLSVAHLGLSLSIKP